MQKLTHYLTISILALYPYTAIASPVSDTQLNEAMTYVQQSMNKTHGDHTMFKPNIIQNNASIDAVYSQYQGRMFGRVLAFEKSGNVYLSEQFEYEQKSALLVHELTHVYQYQFKLEYPCNNAKESEAYTIANAWAADHNQFNLMVSNDFIQTISACSFF